MGAGSKPEGPLVGGLVFGSVGNRGVPVYQGQSPDEVWAIAAILKREIDDLGHYSALAIAREVLRHVMSRRADVAHD